MASEIKFRDLHSGEMQELVGRVPAWPIRVGTYFILGIVISAFLAAYFIRYPEIITAKAIVRTIDPPERAIAKSNGSIEDILVKNGQNVKKDQILGSLASPSSISDIIYLKQLLGKYNSFVGSDLIQMVPKERIEIGDIQACYDSLKSARVSFLMKPKDGNRVNYLKKVLSHLDELVYSWEGKFCLRAPCQGRVMICDPINNNKEVISGETIFFVIPPVKGYEAWAEVPISSSISKIMVGQNVQIRLTEYPYQNFGFIASKVSYISDMPVSKTYFIKLKLLDSLNSLQKRNIKIQPEFVGSADIITADKSLLQRFFSNIL